MNPRKLEPEGRAESTSEKLERLRLFCAYHEAGHAVVLLEGKFSELTRGISIVANGNSRGRTCVNIDLETHLSLLAAGWPLCTEALEAKVICLLAGRGAERKLSGVKSGLNSGARSDLKKAKIYVAAMASDQKESRSMMRSLQVESKLMVETHWPIIKAVAVALFVEKEMDGERLMDVVEEAKQNPRI